MSDQHEPVRLRDAQSGADPLLRQLLRSAAHSGPSAAHKRALDEAILQRIAAQSGSAPEATRTATPARWYGRKPTWAKLLVVIGLAGTAGLGISWKALQPEPVLPVPERASELATPTESTKPSAPHSAASGGSEEPARSDSPAPAVQPAPEGGLRRERSSERAAKAQTKPASARIAARQPVPREPEPSAVQPADHDRSEAPEQTSIAPELELLARAQRALRDDPAEAIELARLHARAYPTGAFTEEREAITIEALFATGQVRSAREQGRDFLNRHKNSAYAPRVARLLQAD